MLSTGMTVGRDPTNMPALVELGSLGMAVEIGRELGTELDAELRLLIILVLGIVQLPMLGIVLWLVLAMMPVTLGCSCCGTTISLASWGVTASPQAEFDRLLLALAAGKEK